MRKTTLLIMILAMVLSFPGGAMADEPSAEASKGKAGTESKDKGKAGKGKDESKGKTESKDKGKAGKGKDEDPPTDKDWDPGKPITGEF